MITIYGLFPKMKPQRLFNSLTQRWILIISTSKLVNQANSKPIFVALEGEEPIFIIGQKSYLLEKKK